MNRDTSKWQIYWRDPYVEARASSTIIFTETDLTEPERSPLWADLFASPDVEVQFWARQLRETLPDKPFANIPPFELHPIRPAEAVDVLLTPGAEPLPGYKLVRCLGHGDFGDVWQARAPGGLNVALKFVPTAEEAVTRAELRALELMRTVRHPHLLTLFGAWQTPDFLIIAMELAEGTLADRLRQCQGQGLQGIPRVELLKYLREAANAIDFLNEFHHPSPDGKLVAIQHGDIKPRNLLMVGDCVKVAAIGLTEVRTATVIPRDPTMTPAYAPPEFVNEEGTRWSDQYSLAVSYCQLRGGRLPFAGNLSQMISGHLEHPPDLSMLPEAERPPVARALAKEPTERWRSCREFVEALATVASSGQAADVLPIPTPMPKPSKPQDEREPIPVPVFTWHLTLEGPTLEPLAVGQTLTLTLRLSPIPQPNSVPFRLPATALDMTVYLEAPGFHIEGEHVRTLAVIDGSPSSGTWMSDSCRSPVARKRCASLPTPAAASPA
ncbi:MAG TPA: protein kinase [Gemmataceae bacterium]|nr:protein kinase [Gemmataceae bacterium]